MKKMNSLMDNKIIKNFLHLSIKYKKFIILFIIILFTGLTYKYFVGFSSQDKNPNSKIVEIEEVHLKDIQQTANLIGTIKSEQQAILTAKIKGILHIIAKPGQVMEKGTLIAEIENDDIKNNFKILKEAEEIAKLQFERFNSLLKSEVVSKAAVEKQRALLLEAQKKLSDAKIALEEIKIYAPFNGVIGSFKFREGSQVQTGDTIVSFYDPSSLIVDFDVPLSIAKQVQNGNPVFVNGKKYSLTHIQKMLDEATHMCPAHVNINCKDCIIGTTTDVTLVVQNRNSVVVIPFEAVFLREGNPFVYVVKKNKAILTAVQLGIRNKQLVEIVSGLKQGDEVIVSGHNRLYPNIPVTIFKNQDAKIS